MQPPSSATCEDVERVELSQVPDEVAQEVCVSPGLMTGFIFDVPASVDLQDEVRFAEVIRGRSGVSFIPPKDMAPGERLRLTAQLGSGESQQRITFTLVAHRGQATRQVEVSRDERTRESYRQELALMRAELQRLREENQRLQAQLVRTGGLQGLFIAGELGDTGIRAKELELKQTEPHSDDALTLRRLVTYRSKNSVAVEVWLLNSGAEPWNADGASLVSTTGEKLEGVRVWQVEPIPPQQFRQVFVEATEAPGVPLGDVTLRIWAADGRTLSISKMSFP